MSILSGGNGTVPSEDDHGPFANETAGTWTAPSNTSSSAAAGSPSPSPSSSSDDDTTRLFLVSFMMALIFMCCLMILLIVKSRLRQEQLRRNENSNQDRDAGAGRNEDGDDDEIAARKKQILEGQIQRRYETIDAWLVTKKVQHHDDACARIVRQYSVKSELHSSMPTNPPGDEGSQNDSHDDVECAICMGPMRPSEWAAWSANEDCTHAFHRACIRPWLLKRTDCPCCRAELLPIDKIRGLEEKFEAIRRLSREHRRRSSLTYCCDCHGLVILRPDVECAASDLERIKQLVNRGTGGSWDTTDGASSQDYGDGSSPGEAENDDGEGRRQSQVIERTESDDEVEVKPDDVDVEAGSEC
jgi:Ring finger domain